MKTARVRLILWPQLYSVARVAQLPQLPEGGAGSPLFTVGHGEKSTFVAPVEMVEALGSEVLSRDDRWRALSLEGEYALRGVGVLAALTRVLAEAGVPVLVFSGFTSDHLLVPDALLGRALAALAQVSVPLPSPALS